MSVYSALIRTNGDVELSEATDVFEQSNRLHKNLDVVSMRSPATTYYHDHVIGFIDDFGAIDGKSQLNKKAWALYGLSPIFGDVLIALEDPFDEEDGGYQPFDSDFVDMICSDIENWIPANILALMDEMIEKMGEG